MVSGKYVSFVHLIYIVLVWSALLTCLFYWKMWNTGTAKEYHLQTLVVMNAVSYFSTVPLNIRVLEPITTNNLTT